MRKFVASLLLLVIAAVPASAGVAGRCRRLCRPEILRCWKAGYTRISCRRTLRAQCLQSGGVFCEFVPPTTTTTLPPPPPPQCYTDQDCQDGNFCNGAEVCIAGRCLPGTPPVCGDGTPALWLGTATDPFGYVNVGMTLCEVGSAIVGNYVCGPGSLSCLASTGSVSGSVVGSTFYPLITFGNGAYCSVNGLVVGLTMGGTYGCYDPFGSLVDAGTWAMTRCP